jgi:hypothetical protein
MSFAYVLHLCLLAATLVPPTKDGIQRRKRHIRPKGAYSLTALAALRGKGQSVELVGAGLVAGCFACFMVVVVVVLAEQQYQQ